MKLVKEQSALQVDLEPFDGNPLEYTYVNVQEISRKGRLTLLIQYTRGEAKDLIKNFINDRP